MKRFSRVYITLVALSLLTPSLLWEREAFAQAQPVTFGDEKLAEVVREALGLGIPDTVEASKQIPRSALETLRSLEGYSRGIVDLTGLEHATGLTTLGLWGNSISDLTPLAGLTHLRSLNLSANSISNVYPLASLTHLRKLVLNDNLIRNVAPLRRLTDLRQLYLAGNSISDVRPLAALTDLVVLYLQSNSISDVAPLSRLVNLHTLGLWENAITDLTPLSGLTRLIQLYLQSNSISDVAPLSGLTNLRTLDLSENSISDVRLLAALTDLKGLGLWGNSIPEVLLHAQLREAGRHVETVPRTTSHPIEVTHRSSRLGPPCPVGWKRQDSFGRATRRVILRAVEVEIDRQNRSGIYKPVAIEIYADPTEQLTDLDGWKLTVAVPYNHPRDYLLTAENATFNEHGIARIESPAATPFPMADVGFSGQRLPGFDYRLFDENNTPVDFAIACYKGSGFAAQLWAMESPRVERNIVIAYLDWEPDYYQSEWRVGAPTAPAAPTAVRRTLTTSWAALKKR